MSNDDEQPDQGNEATAEAVAAAVVDDAGHEFHLHFEEGFVGHPMRVLLDGDVVAETQLETRLMIGLAEIVPLRCDDRSTLRLQCGRQRDVEPAPDVAPDPEPEPASDPGSEPELNAEPAMAAFEVVAELDVEVDINEPFIKVSLVEDGLHVQTTGQSPGYV